jgi:hypothetical protein
VEEGGPAALEVVALIVGFRVSFAAILNTQFLAIYNWVNYSWVNPPSTEREQEHFSEQRQTSSRILNDWLRHNQWQFSVE